MWYVIQVLAGTEHQVEYQCKKMIHEGEEVFIPLIHMEKRVRGVNQQVERTLFPGYVFFDTKEVEDLFFRLKKIGTLTKILKTGDTFTPLREDEEELIMRLGGPDHLVEISTGYKEGDRVVIAEGPLKGLESLIKKINRTKRTAVLQVSLMGEEREVPLGLRVINMEKGKDAE